ncbi:glyoxalase/bleomycin resistance/extradiol dioxygenase family protein [Chelativorans sp. M5D2P16]|uniref:VOC family protein n=1 Tax=Chelativorans sp. M5D2P16 TaxID=3095678 RepID=UPI002ACA7FFF|nr:glyoxalase/bleomycin resistance/extradiol dioxygenase family protein [Chelativorans sp. M5D2P16]MDZ5698095.1 glyoxalase/bleomycin resistance/extradiol dioxygenase family protein [Chelativorans sp. M5D2P16]
MSAIELAPGETGEPRGGVIAYLMVDGTTRAAEVYEKAFGAKEVARHPVDEKGRTMHLHLYINGGSLMMSDPYPEYGHKIEQPAGFSLTLCVDDVDFWWKRASTAEGMEVTMPLEKMFWGDRYGEVRDPFGVRWAIVGK